MYSLRRPVSEEDFRQYFDFRWRLLRAPWKQPQGSERDAIESECFHLMALNAEQDIVGVGRLQLNNETVSQIRYMAVDSNYQRLGVGRLLVDGLEQHARHRRVTTIMLDAREGAVGFYTKLGYLKQQKTYLLFDEIQHYRMVKSLGARSGREAGIEIETEAGADKRRND